MRRFAPFGEDDAELVELGGEVEGVVAGEIENEEPMLGPTVTGGAAGVRERDEATRIQETTHLGVRGVVDYVRLLLAAGIGGGDEDAVASVVGIEQCVQLGGRLADSDDDLVLAVVHHIFRRQV